jgi:hypothetical protein
MAVPTGATTRGVAQPRRIDMIRILRLSGSALFIGIAFVAIAAQAAQAAKFTAPAYPATLHGEGTGSSSFTFGEGRKFECSGLTVSGELVEASETVKLVPKYSGCKMVIAGTEYQTTTTTSCEEGFNHYDGWPGYTRTVCTKNYKHIVTSYSNAEHTTVVCAYELAVADGEGVTFENLGGTKGIKFTHKITGIAYKRTSGSLLLCGPETGSSTYSDTTEVAATNKSKEPISFDIG